MHECVGKHGLFNRKKQLHVEMSSRSIIAFAESVLTHLDKRSIDPSLESAHRACKQARQYERAETGFASPRFDVTSHDQAPSTGVGSIPAG